MEYGRLILGIILVITFTWFLIKSSRRHGPAKALLSFDIILGLLAGLYLIFTSILP